MIVVIMIVGIIIVVKLLSYIITKRNEMNSLKRSIDHAASSISIQKEKRSACLKDALRVLKIGYEHEIEGIEKLTAGEQLSQLQFLAEKYPAIRSIEGYNEASRQAMELNKDISASKEIVNGNIRRYNDVISEFPGLLVAKLLGYEKVKFIDEDNMQNNLNVNIENVDFSQF